MLPTGHGGVMVPRTALWLCAERGQARERRLPRYQRRKVCSKCRGWICPSRRKKQVPRPFVHNEEAFQKR